MQFSFNSHPAAQIDSPALVTYVFEKDNRIEGSLAQLDQATGGRLKRLADCGELTGKTLEATMLHDPPGLAAGRLLLVGAGKPEKFDGTILRRVAGMALRLLRAKSVTRMTFLLREGERNAEGAEAAVEGLLLASFESDFYKTEKKNGKAMEAAALAGAEGASTAEIERGMARGRVIGEAQNFTRTLANEPSNRLTPRMLADRGEEMAREAGLAVDVLDEKRIAELKMGALLSVAQGSSEPPRVIVVTYTPAHPASGGTGAPVLGLVGKAVTFDTGGISIKPSEGMEKMKYDMAGGAAMLGVMKALAALKPAVKVVAVIPSTENMPGGKAQKPGDVQFAMSGKSIEVINTDAEGRLILADGIAYAKKLGCTHLVDAATLTGAIVVALSHINTGVFTNNPGFQEQVLASARRAGEKMWPMPLDDDYRELIKSTIADIQNIAGAGRGGGASVGAAFLREFTDETPWVHLDIAGTAWLDEQKPWAAKGPTGIAVRTLVDLAMSFS
ncbi:MAG TPA: leucyl aminopeptidase [Candidatus Acidoferrales bacterium]|nr:leucyl aminopeptidase [Candidatus Acidoferrales bacterium]